MELRWFPAHTAWCLNVPILSVNLTDQRTQNGLEPTVRYLYGSAATMGKIPVSIGGL